MALVSTEMKRVPLGNITVAFGECFEAFASGWYAFSCYCAGGQSEQMAEVQVIDVNGGSNGWRVPSPLVQVIGVGQGTVDSSAVVGVDPISGFVVLRTDAPLVTYRCVLWLHHRSQVRVSSGFADQPVYLGRERMAESYQLQT